MNPSHLKKALYVLLFSVFNLLSAAEYYVSTTGVDTNSGTIESPFATISRAQQAVSAGDIVYIRGGKYTMTESQIDRQYNIWAYVIELNKSGTSGNPIKYWAYPGEKPVLDFSNVKPADLRVTAFFVSASWLHIKGIEVVGVQVTITTHTQSECFENQGSNNIYENLKMHDGMAIGFYLNKGADNLILNCDAYNNYDPVSEGGYGGNVDGFGAHGPTSTTGNVFRGCRAWFNSDDGYDCISSGGGVTFENCWAFYNGYSPTFKSLGDGNGFKAGGYGSTALNRLPSPIPSNTVRFCLAVKNKASGFYSNHHLAGSTWLNNSAYQNGNNYNMLNRGGLTEETYLVDVPGYDHVMKNNLGYAARSSELTNINKSKCTLENNYFDMSVSVTAADFKSLDLALLTAPRETDGSLPKTDFMQLAEGSDLIDKGVDVGYAFTNNAPDLGAFESPKIVYQYYSLNTQIVGGGIVTLDKNLSTYLQNTDETLTAEAVDGWQFASWSGDVISIDNPLELSMNAEKNIVANFELNDTTNWAVYEAELGTWSPESAVRNQYKGYSWSGYVDTKNTKGQSVLFTVNASAAKAYQFRLVYATTSDRPLKVSVNDTVQIESLSTPSTTDWEIWSYVPFSLKLNKGENTIEFMTLSSYGAGNIDRIEMLVKKPDGVDDYAVWGSSIYPNPVQDVLTVTSGLVKEIAVYSLLGIEVTSVVNSKSINLLSLPSGHYLLKITPIDGAPYFVKCIKA